jgi:hypothetical protein
MTRISTLCVVSSTLVVLALSANGASAFIMQTNKTPKVTVPVPQAKVNKNAVNAYRPPKVPAVNQQLPAVQRGY